MPDLHPTENLFRGLTGSPVELRAGEDVPEASTLFGHFARFDSWNEIDSYFEGNFMERVAKGTFRKTFKERSGRIRVQFDHGYDTWFGGSVLGIPEVLREEDFGPYYEVPLFDADYNHDRLIPMLQGRTIDGRTFGSSLGASYKFRVTRDEWVQPKKATDTNPKMIPERTVREVSLYELGPVVFGADELATSGARSVSLTDHYLELQVQRSGQAARAAQRFANIAGVAAPEGTTPIEPPVAPPVEAPAGLSSVQLRAMRARLARKA